MATVASNNSTKRNMVQVDIEELVARFHGVVEQGELAAGNARDLRRLGIQMDSAAREIVGKTVAAKALGLPVTEIAETLSQISSDLLKAAASTANGDLEAQGLRYLLAREVVAPKVKLEAQGLLKRWDDITKIRQSEERARSVADLLEFRVRVTKKGSDGEARGGEQTGSTYWSNLRDRAQRVFGKFTSSDREQWLQAKKRIADEMVIETRDWVFERLQ